MSYLKKSLILSICFFLFTSCASSYKSINPETVRYITGPENDGISFSYQANVLSSSGNRKLAKKEDKHDIRVVSIKVTNNTGREINFSEDLDLLLGNNVIKPLHPREVTSKVKQSAGSYLLFLLLTPMKLTVMNDDEISEYSIGYGVGPGLALLNMGVASGANSSFSKEMSSNDLYNTNIADGETVYGLIGLSNYNFGTLNLRLKE